MFVGSLQLLGVLYAGVKYPETATWILVVSVSVGFFFLCIGMGFMFYGQKKEEEDKRINISPRIKITKGQREICGSFGDWTPWIEAILLKGIDRQREMTVSFNLGKTQGLIEIEENAEKILQVRSTGDRTTFHGTNQIREFPRQNTREIDL